MNANQYRLIAEMFNNGMDRNTSDVGNAVKGKEIYEMYINGDSQTKEVMSQMTMALTGWNLETFIEIARQK